MRQSLCSSTKEGEGEARCRHTRKGVARNICSADTEKSSHCAMTPMCDKLGRMLSFVVVDRNRDVKHRIKTEWRQSDVDSQWHDPPLRSDLLSRGSACPDTCQSLLLVGATQ